MLSETIILTAALFLCVFFGYRHVGRKFLSLLDNRIHEIKSHLTQVKHEKSDALKRYQAQQRYYLKMKKESDEIIERAHEESKKIKGNIAKEIEQILEHKREQTFNQIESEREKAVHSLQVLVANMSKDVVENLLEKGDVALPTPAEGLKKAAEQMESHK